MTDKKTTMENLLASFGALLWASLPKTTALVSHLLVHHLEHPAIIFLFTSQLWIMVKTTLHSLLNLQTSEQEHHSLLKEMLHLLNTAFTPMSETKW